MKKPTEPTSNTHARYFARKRARDRDVVAGVQTGRAQAHKDLVESIRRTAQAYGLELYLSPGGEVAGVRVVDATRFKATVGDAHLVTQ